jgi:NADP-dependent 3-hydroxy acid dehydrogenase YdfG
MTDPFDLKKEVALVTGASTGMGRRMAVLLAERGAAVAVAARSTERLAKLCDEIAAGGRKAFAVTLDMSDVKSFGQIVDAVETALGPISILINNAGLAWLERVEKAAFQVDDNGAPARDRAYWEECDKTLPGGLF